MYKFCEFYEDCAWDMPMRGDYIPKFGKGPVQFSVFGVLYPYCCTNGGEIWHGGVVH